MATVSEPQIDTEKSLAEYIISRYNSRLKCLSCNIVRPRGAFNRDQAGKNKDNQPSRRYVCKGKALNQCGKTYSPKSLWFLARDQLDPKELLILTERFPIATREPPVEDPMPLKRPRDSTPTGFTPTAKRVSFGIDCTIPPPSYLAFVPEMQPDPCRLLSDASQDFPPAIDPDPPVIHSDTSELHLDSSGIHSDTSEIHLDASGTHSDTPEILWDPLLIPSDPPMHSDPPVIPSDPPDDLIALSSAISFGGSDDLDHLYQILEDVKHRIARLELGKQPYELTPTSSAPQDAGESQEMYVEVARRCSHSPIPRPRSSNVLPIPRDAAALKYDLSVVYLTFLDDTEKKVGMIRERLARAGLKVLNVSLIGSTCVEVLVNGLDVNGWKASARSAGFDVLDGFDPTDFRRTASQMVSNKTSFVRRVKYEIRTSRRRRVQEFYGEWLQMLGWAAETGTPSSDP